MKHKNLFSNVVVVLNLFISTVSFSSVGDLLEEKKKNKRTYKEYQDSVLIDSSEDLYTRNKKKRASTVTRLSTTHDHVNYLREGILDAKRSILITSYGVNDKAFVDAGLYPLLSEARARGVKIYIYNIDSKDIDAKASHFFEQQDIRYDAAFTHAKLFAIDDRRVAIGSYSWLAKENTWENASLCLSGSACKDLVPLLWEDLTYYRNLQFGNTRQIEAYEDDSANDEVDTWKLDHSTTLDYIHSLDNHRGFIAEIFKIAQHKIILCSPFISYYPDYQEDFTHKMLNKALRKNVHIYFVCRSDDPQLGRFRHYLRDVLASPFMHLVTLPNIHLKTVVVDDTLIAEGSFNWLSAARDEESDAHNHEVTLVLDGKGAAEAIHNFYTSPVGQEIVRVSSQTIIATRAEPSLSVGVKLKQDVPILASRQEVFASTVPKNTDEAICVWKISEKGNTYTTIPAGAIDKQSHHIVILKSNANLYTALVDNKKLKTWYRTEEEAKNAAVDSITLL